jgi:hypothetical protein
MIQIENLTQKQRMLCDMMWALDTTGQVTSFINTLPQQDQYQAVTLYTLMILETLDQNMDTENLTLAKQVIDKVK